MLKTMIKCTLSLSICALFADAHASFVNVTKASSMMELNGVLTSVHFNDGDTFKILDGELEGARVRVVGINTLETYGPVHQWLGSSQEYLWDIAHSATVMVQEGSWHCETSGKKDFYGRLLATCDDLSLALVAAGLAHVYSIDSNMGPKNYIKKQKIAQEERVGMWQFGIPQFIITSLHSADEGSDSPYNRLISTKDGSSELWHHNDNYGTCENVCLEDDGNEGDVTCMIYVPYGNRYGRNRPDCLRSSKQEINNGIRRIKSYGRANHQSQS